MRWVTGADSPDGVRGPGAGGGNRDQTSWLGRPNAIAARMPISLRMPVSLRVPISLRGLVSLRGPEF